jgi:serine/threonine protein phosphatase PrpC
MRVFMAENDTNDDDEMGFTLADDVQMYDANKKGSIADTDVFSITAFKHMETTETGAVSTFTDADPNRKLVANYQKKYYIAIPNSSEPLISPNEDAHAVSHITLEAGVDPEAQLKKVMSYVDNSHRARVDGTTVTTALIMEGMLYTANMGDSPALIAVIDPTATPGNGKKMVELRQITTDHVAKNADECTLLPHPEFVYAEGSGTPRVYDNTEGKGAGLMLTRCMGDSEYQLNHTPDGKTINMNKHLSEGKQLFVIVGSDGIMEKTSVAKIEKALNILAANNFRSSGIARLSPEEIAASMASERYSASKDGIVNYRRNDDTTIVVQPVTEELTKPQPDGKKTAALITVADGHNYQYERTPDDDVVFDEHHKAVPKYEKPLSQTVTEEMHRYMQSPHLMRESRLQRGD